MVERQRTLLVEISSILVDSREVRKRRFSRLCRCAGCAFWQCGNGYATVRDPL